MSRVQLDRADYYELQTLVLRVQQAERQYRLALAVLETKARDLGKAHDFNPEAAFDFDDTTCSLTMNNGARG